jgi:plasmid stability protein
MATLNIKNFPEPLYETLQKQAEHEHRSVAQEVIHLLEHATKQSSPLSILELRGLGKDLWENVDAVAHVRAERESWDS